MHKMSTWPFPRLPRAVLLLGILLVTGCGVGQPAPNGESAAQLPPNRTQASIQTPATSADPTFVAPPQQPRPPRIAFIEGAGDPKSLFVVDAHGANTTPFFATPVDADCVRFSPDGSRAAYVKPSSSELYLVQPNAGQPTLLSSFEDLDLRGEMGGPAGCPHWSPDGRYLAVDFDQGPHQAFTVVLEVDHPERIVNLKRGESDGSYLSWDPASQRVAFMNGTATYLAYSVFVEPIAARDGSAQAVSWPGSRPAWSPDGQLLAFSSEVNPFGAREDLAKDPLALVLVEPAGRELRRLPLKDAQGEPLMLDRLPMWSPDGAQIAWLGGPVAPREEYSALYMVATDGGSAPRLIADEVAAASWSPVSATLAYLVPNEKVGPAQAWNGFMYLPAYDLYLADAAGGAPRLVASDVKEMAWSPDGSALALVRYDPATLIAARDENGSAPPTSAVNDLYLVAPDGSGLRQLTSGRAAYDLAWLPPVS